MDPQVSTSFIPKKNLDNGASRSQGTAGATGLLLLIAILIFITSLVAAGAAFLYKSYLTQSIETKTTMLKTNQDAYDFPLIQEFQRTDLRINQSKALLAKHVAPSAIFAFLGLQTLQKVQFTSFNYSLRQDGNIDIALQGLADSYSTVAVQSNQFGTNKQMKDVVFSGVSSNAATNQVGFAVTATLSPAIILYSNVLAAASGGAAAQGSTTTP